MKETLNEKPRQNKHLRNEVTKMNKGLEYCRCTTPKGQAEAPNVRMQELPSISVLAAHIETKHKVLIR
jgi:hypothetical protein